MTFGTLILINRKNLPRLDSILTSSIQKDDAFLSKQVTTHIVLSTNNHRSTCNNRSSAHFVSWQVASRKLRSNFNQRKGFSHQGSIHSAISVHGF